MLSTPLPGIDPKCPAQRRLGHVTDQESMVRAHCREALGRAPRESSFSAKDLADFYGLPQEALAKILQRLARAGLLLSHHGIKGGGIHWHVTRNRFPCSM